ncbi:MAG: hypothetical protein IK037_03370, partial [Clostridia bacterium]|nr:hypothetical protein [Clostridia bacterium]
ASVVEEVLRGSNYRGHYFMQGGRPTETRDLADYSRALAKTISALVEIANVTLSPQETVLFGEYLSEAFFERVKEDADAQNLVYYQLDKRAFALGSALCALTKSFFS